MTMTDMANYSLEENTSTTSYMSESGSISDGPSLDAYIGDIDSQGVQAQRTRLEAFISGNHQKSSLDGKDDDSSHDDSLSYDTFMKEIQQDIWKQVEKKKEKKKEKKRNQLLALTNKTSQQSIDHQNYLSTTEKALHLLMERRRNYRQNQTSNNFSGNQILQETSPTISQDKRRQDDDASDSKSKAPHNLPTQRPPVSIVTNNEKERTSMGNVQDCFEGLLVDDPLVLDEPSCYDPFEGIDQESLVPVCSQTSKAMGDAELDSVFETILSIDINGNRRKESSTERENQRTEKDPRSLQTSRDPPTERETTLSVPARHVPKDEQSEDTLLKVRMHGSRATTVLCLPISLIEKRENEMFKIAFDLGIKPDKWNGSILSTKIRSLPHEEIYRRGAITLDLYPEKECSAANFSQTFRWQSWMNRCIESFYKHGAMRVPDDAIGSDVLVAIQYFAILYTQGQLIFDSFETFLRVKKWSEYFAYRSTIANWLLQNLRRTGTNCIFATCPYPLGKGQFLRVGRQEAHIFDGGIFMNPKRYGKTKSSSLVFSFFNRTEDGISEQSNIDQLMREDFSTFFQNLFPGFEAVFLNRRVKLGHKDGTREQLKVWTLHIMGEKSIANADRGKSPAYYDFATPSNSDEATKSTSPVSPIPPNTKVSEGCQLDTAQPPSDESKETKKTLEETNHWIPLKSLECVPASSYLQYENSQMPALWKSKRGPTSKSMSIAKTPGSSVRHIAPLPTRSASETSFNQQPLNVDHVYEDLWLQDTAFHESWDCEGLRDNFVQSEQRQVPTERDTPEPWIPDFRAQWAANQYHCPRIPKDQSLFDQPQCVGDHIRCKGQSKKKQMPNDCVLAEFFDPFAGKNKMEQHFKECGQHQTTNRQQPASQAISSHQHGMQRLRNFIDILDETSAAESSVFDGIIPRRMTRGVDFPYDEQSGFSCPT